MLYSNDQPNRNSEIYASPLDRQAVDQQYYGECDQRQEQPHNGDADDELRHEFLLRADKDALRRADLLGLAGIDQINPVSTR